MAKMVSEHGAVLETGTPDGSNPKVARAFADLVAVIEMRRATTHDKTQLPASHDVDTSQGEHDHDRTIE